MRQSIIFTYTIDLGCDIFHILRPKANTKITNNIMSNCMTVADWLDEAGARPLRRSLRARGTFLDRDLCRCELPTPLVVTVPGLEIVDAARPLAENLVCDIDDVLPT